MSSTEAEELKRQAIAFEACSMCIDECVGLLLVRDFSLEPDVRRDVERRARAVAVDLSQEARAMRATIATGVTGHGPTD